jgi:hypothetical protein
MHEQAQGNYLEKRVRMSYIAPINGIIGADLLDKIGGVR